jgi:hypothetical protein
VSLLCLLLVLLFALNSFWTKTRFLLKSLLCSPLVSYNKNGGKNEKERNNTEKYVVKRLQTTIPIGILSVP